VATTTAATPAARLGQILVIVAIAITLLGDLVVISLTIPGAPSSKVVTSVIRWLLTAALFYAIWRGHTWARWLTVGLLSVGLLMVTPGAYRTLHPLLIGVMLQFAIAVGLLAFPPSVGAFLALQRERYGGGP